MLYRMKRTQFTKACFDSISKAKEQGLYGTHLEIHPYNVNTISGLIKSDAEARKLLTEVSRRLRKNGVRTYILPAMVSGIDYYPKIGIFEDGEPIEVAGFNFEEEALDIYEVYGEYGLRLYFKKCGYWLVMEWD